MSAEARSMSGMLDFVTAVQHLRAGAVVCYPTETFFAVGCFAFDQYAIQQVFRAKRRSEAMPLPVIIGEREQLALLTDVRSALVNALADAFWPGALSILVTASAAVPAALTGESGRLAVRLSSHPVARALCRAVQGPLVSTSANVSGRPAVTKVEQLDTELLCATAGVLDMQPEPAGGKASTLVEIAGQNTLRIVRSGAISQSVLCAAGFMVVS